MANPQKEGGKIDGGATIWARQTIDSEIFSNKPDKWFKIWFFLINQVNHKDTKQFKRGSGFTRYEWIMEKTKATRNEIDHCIRWLKSATMIATQKATRGFIITIYNYERFQTLSNYKSDTKSDSIGETKAKQKRHKSDTINKYVNNDKNVNKEPPIPPKQVGGLLTQDEKLFEEARKEYPGTKRGLSTEFTNFRKKHRDWKQVISLLSPAIEKQILLKTRLKEQNKFVPEWKHFRTWINQRCWEEEAEMPRSEWDDIPEITD